MALASELRASYADLGHHLEMEGVLFLCPALASGGWAALTIPKFLGYPEGEFDEIANPVAPEPKCKSGMSPKEIKPFYGQRVNSKSLADWLGPTPNRSINERYVSRHMPEKGQSFMVYGKELQSVILTPGSSRKWLSTTSDTKYVVLEMLGLMHYFTRSLGARSSFGLGSLHAIYDIACK